MENCLKHGCDKIRFEYCVDNLGNPQYLRAIQEDSSGEELDEQLQRHIKNSIEWTIFCVILDLHVIGGISSEKERQACFFMAVDAMKIPMLTPRFTENDPRMIPDKMKWISVQNTVYWFDLKIAQDKGLEFLSIKEQCDILV